MADATTASAEGAISFGPFRLIPEQRLLLEGDRPVRLGSRALDILIALTERAGEVLGKDELMARVWPNTFVEEGNLKFQVGALRRTLGGGNRYLVNVPGRGYYFAAPVARTEETPAGAPHATATETTHNLPAQLTRLIGRTGTVSRLAAQLPRQRLLTIVGPGGIGKTSVALAVAEGLIAAYEHGVWLIDLAPLADPRLVPTAVAAVLGLEIRSEDPLRGVIAVLRDKRMLLVLDDCAHVIDVAAALAIAVRRSAVGVHILATSREALRIEGEHVHRLSPLASPSASVRLTAAEALGFPGVQLFVERAAASLGEFELSDADAPLVGDICRKLDGIPLAIEFAAARVEAFGIHGLAAHLDERLWLLMGRRRTALPRHRTLSAMLDWSYQLLTEAEQRVLRRLAIFVGGFTLEAAGAVAADATDAENEIIDQVSELVAKSLVAADMGDPEPRLRLLETTRAYAIEKLAENGEADWAARRHAAFFRDLFAPAAAGSELQFAVEDMARDVREIDNVRAALDWSFSPVGDPAIGVVLTAAYAPVWLHLSLVVECRERTERALNSLGPDVSLSTPLRTRLHIALELARSLLWQEMPGELFLTMGGVEGIKIGLAKEIELAERQDDLDAQLRTLWALWSIEFAISECRAAQSTAERFARIARRTGDPADVLVADRLMGNALHHRGKQREAQNCFERVLEFYVAPKNQRHTFMFQYDQRVMARAMLARVLWLRGSVDQAVDQAQRSLEEVQPTDPKLLRCRVLHYAVYAIALMTGDFATAERAVAMLSDLATSLNTGFWTIVGRCLEGKLLIKRGEFETGSVLLRTALDACTQTGWMISYPQFMGALGEGLAGLGQTTEALAAVDQALARAQRGGEQWYVAELLRIKGEVLLRNPSDRSISAAEGCFLGALEVARQHDALSWELRTATSLARLRRDQGRRREARDFLASVYGRFTEGFGTADLQTAKRLLEQLS